MLNAPIAQLQSPRADSFKDLTAEILRRLDEIGRQLDRSNDRRERYQAGLDAGRLKIIPPKSTWAAVRYLLGL